MAITLNRFKCPNGHAFEANAKLRTRCPDCGVSTKRSFEKVVDLPKPEEPPKPESLKPESPKLEKLKTGPVLVRQGRPRMPRATAKPTVKKPTLKKPPIGSKVSAGLVKSHKTRGVMPTIKRRPVKTAVARGIKTHEQVKPYWHGVAEKYGLG